jgi:hypothetical protein
MSAFFGAGRGWVLGGGFVWGRMGVWAGLKVSFLVCIGDMTSWRGTWPGLAWLGLASRGNVWEKSCRDVAGGNGARGAERGGCVT